MTLPYKFILDDGNVWLWNYVNFIDRIQIITRTVTQCQIDASFMVIDS